MENDINNNIFYNYVYLDPRKPGDYNYGDLHFDYEPFYIGKGSYNRMYDHLNEQEKDTYNPYKVRIINKIKNKGLIPIIFKIYQNLEESISFQNEMCLIKTIGRHDKNLGPLTNLNDGGKGSSGHKWTDYMKLEKSNNMKGDNNPFYNKQHTEKTLKIMSDLKKGKNHPNYGKNRNISTILKISNSLSNKKKSKEHCKNISLSKRKEKHPNWNKKRIKEIGLKISKSLTGTIRYNSKNVYLYDLKLNVIKIYGSLFDIVNNMEYTYDRICSNVKHNSKVNIDKYAILDKKYITSHIQLYDLDKVFLRKKRDVKYNIEFSKKLSDGRRSKGNNANSKKIYQKDKFNNIVNVWVCINDCIKDLNITSYKFRKYITNTIEFNGFYISYK